MNSGNFSATLRTSEYYTDDEEAIEVIVLLDDLYLQIPETEREVPLQWVQMSPTIFHIVTREGFQFRSFSALEIRIPPLIRVDCDGLFITPHPTFEMYGFELEYD
jgi:hypothetical protein